MGVKHHLLRLARIGPNKRHPAVAEANMRHLDRRGRAIDQDNFLAPVELIRLTGTKAQRNISISGCGPRRLRPTGRIAPYRIIAAVVSLVAQFFIYPDKRQAFALGMPSIVGQHIIQLRTPGIDLRTRLGGTVIAELRRTGTYHLAHSGVECG